MVVTGGLAALTFGPRYLNFFFRRFGYTCCRKDGQKYFEKPEAMPIVKIEEVGDDETELMAICTVEEDRDSDDSEIEKFNNQPLSIHSTL